MKSTVFVRPNLKAFIVGGVLLVVVQHFMMVGHSQSQSIFKPLTVNAREPDEGQLREMIRHATEFPSADTYMKLSAYYERRGDYRRALIYLRRAERVEFSETLN
jgi:hypothetical protein